MEVWFEEGEIAIGALTNLEDRPTELNGLFRQEAACVHQTLCVTPAMEAGIADHVWGLEEIVRLAD